MKKKYLPDGFIADICQEVSLSDLAGSRRQAKAGKELAGLVT